MKKDNRNKIRVPEKNERYAEFIGILLGDGNILVRPKTNYSVRIAGDSRYDREYLINFVAPLCKELFDLNASFYKQKNSNELLLTIYGIELTNFLVSEGFKAGDKIRNNLTIPDWIWENDDYLKACVRGLIDTDGSVYRLTPHWPNLFQLSFKNNNNVLLTDVHKAFKKLGFKISNISRNVIYLTRKSEIKKFYKEVGFSNPKHEEKIAPWCSGQI